MPFPSLRHILVFSAPLGFALGMSGCIERPDCGICDPENLILESISGPNYANDKVHLVSPECEGDRCPEPFDEGTYGVSGPIGLCLETKEAKESPWGPEEYCKIAPNVVSAGLEFLFNNLLEGSSVELVRRDPNQPQIPEVFRYKADVVTLTGPTARFNGDYTQGTGDLPDIVRNAINLSCIDNLRLEGRTFTHTDYENPDTNPCNTINANTGWPYKMWHPDRAPADDPTYPEPVVRSYRGEIDDVGWSCATPTSGPDVCCTSCDYQLSVGIAKYGVDGGGQKLAPENAITCDASGDKYQQCRGFIPWVDREDEVRRYHYAWDSAEAQEFRVPLYDHLRETHPDDRPDGLVNQNVACDTVSDCTAVGLRGTECIGRDAAGNACQLSAGNTECTGGHCEPEWFVACDEDTNTTGSQGYCVDRRFSDAGAASCLVTPSGGRLANCNTNGDSIYSAQECCPGGTACDPAFQPGLQPVVAYDRDSTKPIETYKCRCVEQFADADEEETCADIVQQLCYDSDGNFRRDRENEYALRRVARVGGVIYDPAARGFEWRPAHLGDVDRAFAEKCAEQTTSIGPRNVHDGWTAHTGDNVFQSFEDFDRAMCSGSVYEATFGVPGDDEFVVDKNGNSLEGKHRYRFETPQFHVVPGSGFPTNSLRIGACDDFSVVFSNKYDITEENLKKLQIWELGPEVDGVRGLLRLAAGGEECAETVDELETTGGVPCLTVDVSNQITGRARVSIDPVVFGAVLEANKWYRLRAPGLATIDEMRTNPEAYRHAFWDACGMPLIEGTTLEEQSEGFYDFKIDQPSCQEDKDADGVPLSCDNARDVYNPNQSENYDGDGFGDVIDLCPTVATQNNMADRDQDGIGNECDACKQPLTFYNTNATDLPAYMRVRNIPFQSDVDDDGIGDVCDNCVQVANCEDYGSGNAWSPGDPISDNNTDICQRDENDNMIGDECDGAPALPNAAGPVGFGAADDFDQDGIANMVDKCPRQPLEDFVTCSDDTVCGDGRVCTNGVCNHVDTDGDAVGDACDTCPYQSNPVQTVEGGMQMDDPDGDFIGNDCEANSACYPQAQPRPFSFHQVASNGYCCIEQWEGGVVECTSDSQCADVRSGWTCDERDSRCYPSAPALLGEPKVPITPNCTLDEESAGVCRPLPEAVKTTQFGVYTLPPGCDAALEAAGITAAENAKVTLDDVGNDLDALWEQLCFLPPRDQDFDGVGDICDRCPFDFDPNNEVYKDANGKIWPTFGKFCNGDYSLMNRCEMDDGGGTGTGGESGGESGTG